MTWLRWGSGECSGVMAVKCGGVVSSGGGVVVTGGASGAVYGGSTIAESNELLHCRN